jgi:hypothetical protein
MVSGGIEFDQLAGEQECGAVGYACCLLHVVGDNDN